ncbi:MAG TPA: FAD-binding and (Fe-S)-binding domain-containing protein [Ornithinimicrobium sp.]|uniref:FAD-binding and (Fe-S)-binding domain-containing protein n=1 Tax=Ornithinimicrobium sp. TaxID=1977084 RepID=UPI002B48DEAC|nr:FAD-binding and (Fe-S)-binding domain-containing protein [Ornithinimicrobium sp.]HKJ11038.1 FAD-binding and (Fe-S)-binding domain-containing protein [Ornithinimicrobium sp.]
MPVPASLAGSLRAEVRGQVRTDSLAQALYGTDASNYRVLPEAVVVPADEEDLAAAVGLCREAGVPTVLRSGGTSMAGNTIGGVVIDVSRHLRGILDLDADSRTAVVQPGVVLTDLMAAARPHGLTFGADPSSASRATLGGMIANNACGAHSVAWGTTADNTLGLDVIAGDGRRLSLTASEGAAARPAPGRVERDLIAGLQRIGGRHRRLIERQFGTFSRQISGYALQHLLTDPEPDAVRLLCGSEGSLATTLQATVRLVELPTATVLLALGFASSADAARSVPLVLPHGPLTIESINATLVDRLPHEVRRAAQAAGLPEGSVWLLVEVPGEAASEAAARAEEVAAQVRDGIAGATASVVSDPGAKAVLWRCRKDGTGLATRRADGAEAWCGWEDAAVPPARLADYLEGLDELLAKYGYSGASYGHFGEGCMHMRIDFDFLTESGRRDYRSFIEQATDLVTGLGGSVSGEHGDGRARGEMVARMYGPEAMAVFAEVKNLFDPDGVLNPGVIVDPPPVDVALRQAGAARLAQPETLFAYPDDNESFAQAQRRCVGVGSCRQTSGGVMCPSFQVTKEEQHSTRGRARVLFEMLEGDVITDGWRSSEVRDALDLCLSCKGCLSDCPVNVDMATYKAEFTHHHYARRPWARPRSHWSMGWLPVWAQVASRAPRLVNAVTGSAAAPLLRAAGGIAADRDIPAFAHEPFARWFARRTPEGTGERGPVLLWPDTFTNALSPQVGRAAVRVLEDAGFSVHLPTGPVCCGLTWISTGQLGMARRVLRRSLRTIAPALRAGAPVVGLEPSCTAALRHDAADLLADEPLARAAREQTLTVAELLEQRAPDWQPPQVGGEALVQVHCHQHAVMGFDADRRLMDAAGIEATVPDSGCCGLAGNFGFEAGHEELSRAVGERVILPEVRAADPATSVLADGFSCRTQIGQETPRQARHLVELLADGLLDRSSRC